MSKTLIKWQGNWADEIDAESWMIVEASAQTLCMEYLKQCRNIFENHHEFEHWIGTNEAVLYYSPEELFRSFSFIPITDAQEQFLLGTFGRRRAVSMPDIFKVDID